MATLPGELVLQSPWRPRPQTETAPESPRASKKARPSVQSISVTAKPHSPGAAAAAVEWGAGTRVHVTVAAPRQPSQSSMSHDHGILEVEVYAAPFATTDQELLPESEIARLAREGLTSIIDLSAYPKSVISLKAVVLAMQTATITAVMPAIILGATAALEAADLSLKGRLIGSSTDRDGVVSVTAFDIISGRLAILHSPRGLPDIAAGLSTAKQLESDLCSLGSLKPRN